VNDLYDQDLDKKVERTKTRPLASNQVSPKKAVAFLLGQLSVGLLILLQFNTYSIYVGICSLLFVFTYPLFKRFTYWPQMMLGFTFNWGCFIGYSSVLGFCDWYVTIPLYIGLFWD
jgi:4-hydroxybenzoate polyprenyltransferase